MRKSSSEAVSLPQRKQWTPPKPSYCSPKPVMVANRSPFGIIQQQHRVPVPSLHVRMPHSVKHSIDPRHDSFDPTVAPLAEAAALSLANNSFGNCLPTQPLSSPDEQLDEPSLERLSTWSFDYSPPASDSDASPTSCTFSPATFYITPSCSPKSRVVALPSVPPLNLDNTNDRSVFEKWEDDDKQERLCSNPCLASGNPLATGDHDAMAGFRVKSSRSRAPRRFFHTRAASQQSCDDVETEQDEGVMFAEVRGSASTSADGHTGVGSSTSRLQKLSKFVRQNSSAKVPTSQRASDMFFDPRTDKDAYASEEQLAPVRSISDRTSKPPPRQAKSSARSLAPREATKCTGLGLENVSMPNVLPLLLSSGKSGEIVPSAATSRSTSRASKMASEDELSLTSSPALRFDPLRRPRAPFPVATSTTSSPVLRESPILQNARPLRPIPIKAATLLGTLPGSMYPGGAKHTASASSSSGSSDATLKPLTRLVTRPSSLAHQPQMHDLPPCPNRMHKLNEIIRPKASRSPRAAAEAVITPPARPARPTQRNIFAFSDEEGDNQKKHLNQKAKSAQAMSSPPPSSSAASVTRPLRSSKRSNGPLPGALPPPRSPLPPVPSTNLVACAVASKEKELQTPPGWTNEKSDVKVSETVEVVGEAKTGEQPVQRQPFIANLVEEVAEIAFAKAANSTVVHIDVGGLNFATTLNILCPQDGTVNGDGLAAWLLRESQSFTSMSASPLVQLSPPRTEERCSQNSVNSYDEGEDADDSGETSASSMVSSAPSLSLSSRSSASGHGNDRRLPMAHESAAGLKILHLHAPATALDDDSKDYDRRSGLARTPTSVSMDSAFHHHLEEELKEASHAHDSGSTIEAWRHVYHNSHSQAAPEGDDNAMPTFVFSPARSIITQQRRLRVTLPAQRNPLCYPAILFALQHHALPAYFAKRRTSSTAEQRRRDALLLDIRDEATWLGYTHLISLCDRYV